MLTVVYQRLPRCRLRDLASVAAAQREAALIEQFLRKCAEDDRREALAIAARRAARARYWEEAQAHASQKEAAAARARVAEAEAEEAQRAKEAFRASVVEEARRRMLAEHAEVLRGHLPRGVLHSQDDLLLLKAFDRDGDGVLNVNELELAAVAFKAAH